MYNIYIYIYKQLDLREVYKKNYYFNPKNN